MVTTLSPTQAESQLSLAPGQFPFESRYRNIHGARIHYVDEGDGPVLFMVHGNPTWSFLYRHLILGLRHRFRCIAVDLPGFGLSETPAGFGFRPEEHAARVAALLAELQIEGGTLIAHDWGGPIGLAAAFAQPGRLTRFVLGNTWAWPVNGIWHFEWFSRLMGGPVGRFGARRFNLFVNGVLPAAMRRGPLPEAVLAAYRAPLQPAERRTGTHAFPRCITASRDFLAGLADGLGKIDGTQVLFLWPDRDIAFRDIELARWKSLFPQATTVILPNCGHYLWEEAADEAVSAIDAWLGGKQPPGQAEP
ncbi:MAG TPA: alpha/beta fold hydrolase [Rhodocyclaceae bacterium]|nr:alpha/beta fold hydrolase [Rhodocyclaceae bacterium]